jgi:hypothetical protein
LTRAHLEERVAAFDAQRTLAETRRREADALWSAARTHAAAESDRTLARESLATMALEHAQALENRVPAHTEAQERAHALETGEREHALLAARLRVARELDARAQEERAALARADAEGARLERELASVVDERALMEAVVNILEESAATDSVETNAIPEGNDTSRADVVSARAAAQLTSTHLAHPLLDPVIAQVRKRERARDALEATRRRGNEERNRPSARARRKKISKTPTHAPRDSNENATRSRHWLRWRNPCAKLMRVPMRPWPWLIAIGTRP